MGNVDNEHVLITWEGNNTVIAVMKNSFVKINMTMFEWASGSGKYINFRVCVHDPLCDQFEVDGHLGNCDGDRSNDWPLSSDQREEKN